MRTNRDIFKKYYHDGILKNGFKYKDNQYYRVRGDIFQKFKFLCFSSMNCYVRFVMLPLSEEYEEPSTIVTMEGHEEISSFKKFKGYFSYNDYIDGKHIDKETAIGSYSRHIFEGLIPMFDRSIDSKSALNEWNSFDIENFGHIQYYSNEKYYMALRCHDYDFAEKYLRTKISVNEDTLRDCLEKYSHLKDKIDRVNKRLKNLRDMLIDVQSRNYEYFDSILQQNEQKNIEALKELKYLPKNFELGMSYPDMK